MQNGGGGRFHGPPAPTLSHGDGSAKPVMLALLLLLLLFCSPRSDGDDYTSDLQNLLAFREKLLLDPQSRLSSWKIPGLSFCVWDGLFCDSSRRLKSIDIADGDIEGTISPAIGGFSHLDYLNLSGNRLAGSIPPEIGNCVSLRWLDLSRNALNGNLPSTFGRMAYLRELDISSNKLWGSFPESIQTCTELRSLSLRDNRFSGHTSFSILSKLQAVKLVDLSKNRLEGPIPPNVQSLKSVEILDLEDNLFSSGLPKEIGFLENLKILNIGKNSLTGHLPPELGNCSKLQELRLYQNDIWGPIPWTIYQIHTLIVLDLGDNAFSQSIPSTVMNCNKLQELNLKRNLLVGAIPAEIGRMASLVWNFDLSHNSLTGIIPGELGNLALIGRMDLSANKLIGEIPPSFGNCESLVFLDISNNKLNGSLPSSCGNLDRLEYLNVSRNGLLGNVPTELGQLVLLKTLDLSVNRFSGAIPSSFASLEKLSKFNISQNLLVGSVPETPTFRSFEGSAFANNSGLCGWITGIVCPTVISTTPEAPTHERSSQDAATASIVVAIVVLLLLGLVFWGYLVRLQPEALRRFSSLPNGTFTAEALFAATDSFDVNNLMEEGVHYMVFKGFLDNGRAVAVKRLRQEFFEDARASFSVQWKALSRAQHQNLVSVLGWCSSPNLLAVVLALMSNGSLDTQLHDTGTAFSLDWNTRFRIAAGVAAGLAYIHREWQVEPVVRCDVKASSILLDDNLEPHLIDYKLLKSGSSFSRHVGASTTIVIPSGYTAPECKYGAAATVTAEVYNYGVVVLELITGKKPDTILNSMHKSIVEWVNLSFPNNAWDIVDPVLMETDHDPEQVLLLMELALFCTKTMPDHRPSMLDVLSILQSVKSE